MKTIFNQIGIAKMIASILVAFLFFSCVHGNGKTNENQTKHEEKKEFTLKTLTIHNLNAASKTVVIKEDSVTKDNVKLSFIEDDAPSFAISPQSFTLNYGEAKKLTISTEATPKYKAWQLEVEVKREKEASAEKTIDDAIEALKSQSLWVNSYVDSDITLLTTIDGFAGLSVSYACDDSEHFALSGQIKKDIADVTLEIKATVTWKGDSKTITLKTFIKRFDKIEMRENAPQGKIITWDFSQDNVLKRLYDGKATHLWEIKSVDVKKKLLVAKLKKTSLRRDGNLLEFEEVLQAMKEDVTRMYETMFGANYILLVNKDVITWKDLKPYFLSFPGPGMPPASSDEEIFDRFKSDLGYQGTLAEFKALNDAERTKLVKDYLKAVKKSYCGDLGVPIDTPDNLVLEKIVEKTFQQMKKEIENKSGDFTFKYEARHDYFNAKTPYDETKKWCEQVGEYNNSNHAGNRYISITFDGSNTGEVAIRLFTEEASSNGIDFVGTCSLSQPNSFTLTQERNDSIKLQCAVTNLNNGKFTLVTTNAFEGSFEMEFYSTEIEKLLDLR